jgi:2-C-methyl-D-erythritol 2,4-cyclodiphosphate synthase
LGIRVGFGFDVHPLKEGRKFALGGIVIPSPAGADGHSDADVLLHAICDALLGAAGLGDIGSHFPDNSLEFKDIDSKILLKKVMELLAEQRYSVVNMDSTVLLESPKIAPFIPEMRKCMAEILNVEENCISIKATTNEKMGYIGRKEGVSAYAVVLIKTNVEF